MTFGNINLLEEDDVFHEHEHAQEKASRLSIPFFGRPKVIEIPVWTTQDGRQIPVPEMETDHLDNTIAYLKRRIKGSKKALKAMKAERKRRP